MSDFSEAWALSRKRFIDEIAGLSDSQLSWRIYPGTLTIGEMALHLTGVEISFAGQLTGASLDDFEHCLKLCATEGVVNDSPFPFGSIDRVLIDKALAVGDRFWRPIAESASSQLRSSEIKSALGPMITGEGAMARLSFHFGYHHGQAYLIKTSPNFPA